ncbi:hypothetical protein ACFQ44_04905 [Levilactobacillus lanxiensis]|uniref:Uncharacterized protein n=1 Tax=Levilactobacillus lanxiensis TaxID=2799568 RepID=A0ABW4D367_9LACO|nr:hypothetical protein [Levilactobacillus lanxiensis]
MSKKSVRLARDSQVFPRVNQHSKGTDDRFAFNFSFVTQNDKYGFSGKHFDKTIKNKFVEKLIRLSTADLVTVFGWPKSMGLENMAESDVKLAVNPAFERSGRQQNCLAGMWIFRLAKSGRVIGKINGTIFYVLAVDTTFDLYKHG